MKKLLALLTFFLVLPAFAEESTFSSSLDRIKATHEIRCGYNVYSPYLRKDANTGALSGIFYDIMNEVGKNAGLKIVWAEEVGYGEIFTGLDANRYDALCSGIWPNATRGMAGSFSHALFYSFVVPYVRTTDERFHSLADITANNARMTTIDGAMESMIVSADYPTLPRITLPQNSSWTLNFENLLADKADIVFAEPSTAAEFIAKNPNKLRSLGAANAVRAFPNTLAARLGDTKMQDFLDSAVDELVLSGEADRILQKYDPAQLNFLRVAKPYTVSP